MGTDQSKWLVSRGTGREEGEWRESAPLGPAAAPLGPGGVYEGSAPLGRPPGHGHTTAVGAHGGALEGTLQV